MAGLVTAAVLTTLTIAVALCLNYDLSIPLVSGGAAADWIVFGLIVYIMVAVSTPTAVFIFHLAYVSARNRPTIILSRTWRRAASATGVLFITAAVIIAITLTQN